MWYNGAAAFIFSTGESTRQPVASVSSRAANKLVIVVLQLQSINVNSKAVPRNIPHIFAMISHVARLLTTVKCFSDSDLFNMMAYCTTENSCLTVLALPCFPLNHVCHKYKLCSTENGYFCRQWTTTMPEFEWVDQDWCNGNATTDRAQAVVD